VLVVETFVDPERFGGTVYTAPGWGSESGLHPRLDASHLDDPCRVRLPKSMRVVECSAVSATTYASMGAAAKASPTTKPPRTFSPA